jgi:hypothetical protein
LLFDQHLLKILIVPNASVKTDLDSKMPSVLHEHVNMSHPGMLVAATLHANVRDCPS